jgi:ElaB/YqjD/DUF883 family membrane-anchored ribosome-binding protein
MEQFAQPEGNGHDRGETFAEQMQQAQSAAREQLEMFDRTFRDLVAAQPLAAMGVALGLGFLVGRLLRR